MSPKSEKSKRIDYSKIFHKQLKKAPLGIKIAFRERLALFLQNPSHPLLNNHSLSGSFLGKRSINITGDWRAIYYEYTSDDEGAVIIFYLLGTHSQLYK